MIRQSSYKDIEMTRENIINEISSLKRQAKEKYNVELKAVFGSVLTDAFKSASDIDILVEFSGGADLFNFVGLSLKLKMK